MGDARLVVSEPAIQRSQADFIDLHAYPGFELNLAQHVENFGMPETQVKPIIMGEFGAHLGSHPNSEAAAEALMNWQVESCRYGSDGWLLWTWDLPEQYEFYSALCGSGEIDHWLAPVIRPDPSRPAASGPAATNLAFGKNAIP